MIELILNPNFLIPFLSTIGASFTIISLQFLHKFINERKKKLYTVAYMADVSYRLLLSSLVLKKHTILPHIEAVKRMIGGDSALLEKAFLSDEFDILTENTMEFNHLPEDFKVLVGFDNIELIQTFEALIYLNKSNSQNTALNEFVKSNLKSARTFKTKSKNEQIDILNTYWDYLTKIEHTESRLIAFILHLLLPRVRMYINKKYFILCSKKNVTSLLAKASDLQDVYKKLIPDTDFFANSINGGIQNLINEKQKDIITNQSS